MQNIAASHYIIHVEANIQLGNTSKYHSLIVILCSAESISNPRFPSSSPENIERSELELNFRDMDEFKVYTYMQRI